MLNKKKRSETKLIILLIAVLILVCISGAVLYKNLSAVAKKVGSSAKIDARNSLALKQLLIDIREAENDVKSYNLTYNKEHLIAFYNAITAFEENTQQLNYAPKNSNRERFIIRNTISLAEKRFELLKQQLYLDDEEKITDELNTISLKIDEAYNRQPAQILTGTPEKTTVQEEKKQSFFKRLFGKKNKTTVDSLQTAAVSANTNTMQIAEIKGQLKSAVKQVKSSQLEKLAERKSTELLLSKQGQSIVNQIREMTDELEALENQLVSKRIEQARHDMSTIQKFAILFSVVISLLLIVVAYLIINYVRKKREYELALITAKRNAEDLAKTKETFLANMSHEIKTPLNAIYGFTEQVLHSQLDSRQYEQLSIVKKSAGYLSRLINNILSYSKLQAGKMQLENEDFNLKRELEDLVLLFKEQLKEKPVTFVFYKDDKVPDHINADLTKIKQVLFNLLGNAVKFTDEGEIQLIVGIEEKQPHSLKIEIKDTGIGIAPEKIPEMFKEYEQGDRTISKRYGGTGLGLAITQKLIQQMHGDIKVESTLGVGTAFVITIPFAETNQEKYESESLNTLQELQCHLLQKIILIADDEEFNRLLLKSVLLKYGCKVIEAKDGDEAVERMREQACDLILMDLNMPHKDGLTACKEIRMFNTEVPILVSTAVMEEDKISWYLHQGFNGFVYKPFTEKELLESLVQQLALPKSKIVELPEMPLHLKKINVEGLQNISGGDVNFTGELIHIFHKSINEALKEITQQVNHQQWNAAADAAHKTMPPCKHFDAYDLYESLKYFESLRDKEPNPADLSQKLTQLQREVELVNRELQIYL